MKRKAVLFSSLILTVMMIVAFLGYQLGKGTGFTANFEDMPCYPGSPSTASYIIDTNNTHYACYEGFTGSLMSITTDDQTLIQGRITQLNLVGGGMLYLKSGTYSCSLTVKSGVLLLMEPAVTGVTYTVDSGGYCMRYSGGYAYFEHPLNMTGHEIRFGAFHTGTSAPNGVSTGQWWFDTNSYLLKVWNGTAWDAVTGATGAQGPPGQVEGSDFKFMVFQNSTAAYLLNGDTGAIDDYSTNHRNVCQWALNNLSSVRLTVGSPFHEKVVLKGNFSFDDSLMIPSWVILEIQGQVTCPSGADYPILRNQNSSRQDDYLGPGNEAVEIYGGRIRGNGDSDTVDSHGIEWICNDTNVYGGSGLDDNGEEIRIHNIDITWTGGDCLHIDMDNSSQRHLRVYDCRLQYGMNNVGHAIYAKQIFDSYMEQLFIFGQGEELYLLSPVSSHFHNFYCAGNKGVYIYAGKKCVFTNFRVDNPADEGLVIEGEAKYHVFSGWVIAKAGRSAHNTYDALVVNGAAHHNTFTGFLFNSDEKAEKPRYCVYEYSTCDYNLYCSSVVTDWATGAKNINGPNSVWDTNSIIEDQNP